MKKKILLAVTMITLATALVACGGSKKKNDTKESGAAVTDERDSDKNDDSSEADLSKASSWGYQWVSAVDSRIVVNLPYDFHGGGAGEEFSEATIYGDIVMIYNYSSDAGKIKDTKDIFSYYEEKYKHTISVQANLSEISKWEINNEEDMELNGYNFHKIEGKATIKNPIPADDGSDRYYEVPFVAYTTFTKYSNNTPILIMIVDESEFFRKAAGRNVPEMEATIEENAYNMADSLREYEGGEDAFVGWGMYGKELKLH